VSVTYLSHCFETGEKRDSTRGQALRITSSDLLTYPQKDRGKRVYLRSGVRPKPVRFLNRKSPEAVRDLWIGLCGPTGRREMRSRSRTMWGSRCGPNLSVFHAAEGFAMWPRCVRSSNNSSHVARQVSTVYVSDRRVRAHGGRNESSVCTGLCSRITSWQIG